MGRVLAVNIIKEKRGSSWAEGAGHLVYHGPVEEVVGYFEMLGLRCPERKGVADFLQEIASKMVRAVFFCFFLAAYGTFGLAQSIYYCGSREAEGWGVGGAGGHVPVGG